MLACSPIDDCSPINFTQAAEVGRGRLSRLQQTVEEELTPPCLLQVRGEVRAVSWGVLCWGQETQLLSLKGDGKDGL